MPERFDALMREIGNRGWKFRLLVGPDASFLAVTYKIECEHGLGFGRGVRLDGNQPSVIGCMDVLVDSAFKTVAHIEKACSGQHHQIHEMDQKGALIA